MLSTRTKIVFKGGPLDAVVLDSDSRVGDERFDAAWFLALTRGGELGVSAYDLFRFRTQRHEPVPGRYQVKSSVVDASRTKTIEAVFEPNTWSST